MNWCVDRSLQSVTVHVNVSERRGSCGSTCSFEVRAGADELGLGELVCILRRLLKAFCEDKDREARRSLKRSCTETDEDSAGWMTIRLRNGGGMPRFLNILEGNIACMFCFKELLSSVGEPGFQSEKSVGRCAETSGEF